MGNTFSVSPGGGRSGNFFGDFNFYVLSLHHACLILSSPFIALSCLPRSLHILFIVRSLLALAFNELDFEIERIFTVSGS
jgi:hypothetical protein